MAKIELKGIVKGVTEVQNVGKDGATRKQSIILFVPGYRDEFGDQKGEDEEWKLDMFNKRIDDIGANSNLIDKRVKCIVYINSSKVIGKEGETLHFVNTNLGKIQLAENATANAPQAASSKPW